MVSNQISFLKSLQQKKHRKAHGMFLVEGLKSVADFVQSDFYTIKTVFHTPQSESKMLKVSGNIKFQEVSASELEKISSLNTPQDVIALVEIPNQPEIDLKSLNGKFTLMLDGVQDPGNLGTIIRTADWFGITQIICSEDTVDAYNPKVVQATMGSLARIKVHYANLLFLL
ncbi:MAG: RNA methyltransferase, partial [Sphingobacteriaceae bacterium]